MCVCVCVCVCVCMFLSVYMCMNVYTGIHRTVGFNLHYLLKVHYLEVRASYISSRTMGLHAMFCGTCVVWHF